MSFVTWNNQCLNSKYISFKLILSENNISRPWTPEKLKISINSILFALASSDSMNVIISLDQLSNFISLHQKCFFIIPNACVDFLIIKEILQNINLTHWWNIVHESRLCDPIILDMLILLAINDDKCIERTMNEIIHSYNTNIVSNIHESVRCTLSVYLKMYNQAIQLMNQYYTQFLKDVLLKYGPLTENIQVKATISLLEIEISGMHIQSTKVDKLNRRYESILTTSMDILANNPQYDKLFRLPVDFKKPSLIMEQLDSILYNIINEIKHNHLIDINIPKSKDGKHLSHSRKVWNQYEKYHPFIAHWLNLEQTSYYLTFLQNFTSTIVHPQYTTFVRNGRTSCKSPPIQQTPRSSDFREIFVASPGNVIVIIDYKYIELCTLAAVCETRYGKSVLADVIRNNLDPHCFTAAMFEKVTFSEFMDWKSSSDFNLRKKYIDSRQRAKAINFGIPSGLSSSGLREYARTAYQVDLSIEEAKNFRTMVVDEIYPELGIYLKNNEIEIIAKSLGCTELKCRRKFKSIFTCNKNIETSIRNIVNGKTIRKNGHSYSKYFTDRIWNAIEELAIDPDMFTQIQLCNRKGSVELFKKLLGKDVCTLTGRIRGKVGFTQSCNTPFSGLAADGAKLAMWNLLYHQFKLIGFIHDEILIEIPRDSNLDEKTKLIESIVCESMQQLTGSIPISCEYSLSEVWSKDAKAIYDENGKIQVWKSSLID